MASVWLARDERLGREVAVKILSDVLASDPGYRARFEREARVAAGLSHPNLVDVYDFSAEADQPYLVMRYVAGPTLAERTGKRGGAAMDTRRLAVELLDALAYIHEAGVIHRDVKPSNVLFGERGETQLTDFGIARPADATALTQTGHVLGTLNYMAPEVRQGAPASPRSDLYALGVLLAECGAEGDPALTGLIGALQAQDPADRPRSAEAAAALLERTHATRPTATAATARLPATEGLRRFREHRWVVGGLAALAAVAVILALSSGDDDGGPGQSTGAQTQPAQTDAQIAPSDNPDPAAGARLNQEGFQLIQQGQPEQAVPILREAVASFPEGTTDLNYAYALFNLGQALRLSGHPEEAIPILEQRAQIDNQRDDVLAELDKARSEAGG
jgi:serine/threonine protein kinase